MMNTRSFTATVLAILFLTHAATARPPAASPIGDTQSLQVNLEFGAQAPSAMEWYVSTTGNDTTGDGSVGNPWATLQHAISQVGVGDTIHLASGTYVETGQLVISQDLVIAGDPSDKPVIRPAQNTGSSGDARGWWLVQAGADLSLSDVVLDGSGWTIWQGIRGKGTGTLDACEIRSMKTQVSGSPYNGVGVVFIDANWTVQNCVLSDIGRIGIFGFGSGVTDAVIHNNTYVGKGAGDWLDYGIELGGGAVATITCNTVTNCKGVAASDGSTSAGVLIDTYYGPGTAGTLYGNVLTGNTAGIAAGYDSSDTAVVIANYNDLSGNDDESIDNTSATNTVDAANNWWGTTDPVLIEGLIDGNVDASNPLSSAAVRLAFAGSRLVSLQNNDGGWDWPLDDGDPGSTSPLNTVGPIAMGLAKAYRASGDADMLTSLQAAGALLLSKTNNFSPSDGYLAAELDDILGGTTYVDHVMTNFYGPLAAGTYDRNGAGTLYDTAGYVDLIRTARANQGIGNLAAWDVGMGLVGAVSSGVTGTDLQPWIDGTKGEIDELDGSAYYDVVGLAGAVFALALAGEDHDPVAGEHAAAGSLADLADILAGYQIVESGGFTWNSAYVIPYDANETMQETAYAILALAEVGGYGNEILAAAEWMATMQLPEGGLLSYVGGGENNEVTAEGVWGIWTATGANVLELNVEPASLFLQPGENLVVDMDVLNLQQKVNACQAMLGYSSTYFDDPTTGAVQPGGSIWDQVIYDSWFVGSGVPGEIDTAIGVNAQGAAGTDTDETVAIITLVAGTTEGITQMVFRPDADPDPGLTQSTFLSDLSANPIWPTKIDSQTIVIDGTDPVVANLAATQDQGSGPVDVLDCATATLQGTVNISVDASDALAGLESEPVVTVTQGGDALTVTYDGEGPAGTFNYSVVIAAATANGTWDIEATATDKSGNSASVSGTLCVNKNQITGTVSMDTFSSGSYSFDRDVVFKATDSGGSVLATWTETINFTNSASVASGSYVLTDVPDATANLSAKTAWSLRERQSVSFDVDGQAVNNFTLPGGDLNDSNSVNILDYSILKVNWNSTNAVADINGDGSVQLLDYSLMKDNWFQMGDPE